MRKGLSIVLSLALLFSSLFMLSSVVSAESKFNIEEDAAIADRIKAFTDIKALFTGTPVLADVKALYVSKFQADVKRLDTKIAADNPKIDESIAGVLELAIKGDLNAGQAKQAVDKGLQWYFYMFIRDLMSSAVRPAMEKGDTATAKKEFDKAVQVYEGVTQSTVQKRDASYGLDMAGLLKGTIEQIQADIAAGNLNDFNVHRQVLDKTIIKTYALGTYTYAQSVATKSDADKPAAITEGYFMYMSAYAYLKGGSPEDANYVKDAFGSGDSSRIDGVKIKDALQRAMIGKVSEYLNNVFVKLKGGDLQGARGYAMEGLMFVSTQEAFFTKAQFAGIIEVGNKFREAVDNNDLKAAEALSFQLVGFFADIDGARLKVGTANYKLNGKASVAVAAPYVNKQTNRTLVPIRLLETLIGATITYDQTTSTVSIVKDGKTTALTVGSDKVVQDGKVSETVKLDQPVVLKNDRTFIPFRAVAELFGKGVFYANGEIIVLR